MQLSSFPAKAFQTACPFSRKPICMCPNLIQTRYPGLDVALFERNAEQVAAFVDEQGELEEVVRKLRVEYAGQQVTDADVEADAHLEVLRQRCMKQRAARDRDAGVPPFTHYTPVDVRNYRQFARQFNLGMPPLQRELIAARVAIADVKAAEAEAKQRALAKHAKKNLKRSRRKATGDAPAVAEPVIFKRARHVVHTSATES